MTMPDAHQQVLLWLCRAMGILVQLTLCLLGTVLAGIATVAYKLHQLLGPLILKTSWNLWMQGGARHHSLRWCSNHLLAHVGRPALIWLSWLA